MMKLKLRECVTNNPYYLKLQYGKLSTDTTSNWRQKQKQEGRLT